MKFLLNFRDTQLANSPHNQYPFSIYRFCVCFFIASDFHSSITIDILPYSAAAAAAYSIRLFHIFLIELLVNMYRNYDG